MRRKYHTLLKQRNRLKKYGTKALQQGQSAAKEPVQEIASQRETPPAPAFVPILRRRM